jgi:hypothetical protein
VHSAVHQKDTSRSSKIYFAVVNTLVLVLLGATIVSCGTKRIPVFNGKIWALDVEDPALVRAQENERIPLSELDPLTGYIVLSGPDFELFVNTYVTNCKEWYGEGTQLRELSREIKTHDPR